MRRSISQEEASLADILIAAFEKTEILDGTHWRDLPMPDEEAAVRKFHALVAEARRWKGEPVRVDEQSARRIAAWPDLDIRQAGRGIMVRVRAPWFDWWNEDATWRPDPMGPIHDWLDEEERLSGGR